MKAKLYIFEGIYSDGLKLTQTLRRRLAYCTKEGTTHFRTETARWGRFSRQRLMRLVSYMLFAAKWLKRVSAKWASQTGSKVPIYTLAGLAYIAMLALWSNVFVLMGIFSLGWILILCTIALLATIGVILVSLGATVTAVVAATVIACSATFAYAVAFSLSCAEWIPVILSGSALTCHRCGDRWQWPRYFCAACGQPHDDLFPNVYGFAWHTCDGCATRIPAMVLTGRHRLKKQCKACGGHLGETLGADEMHLAVVGARGSGKSNMIITGIAELVRVVFKPMGFKITIPDPAQAALLRQWFDSLNHGQALDKTSDHRPAALNILLTHPKRRHLSLYLYDASGEIYENVALLHDEATARHHMFIDGMVIVLDPFAEEYNKARFQLTPDEQSAIGPAEVPLGNVVDRLTEFLEKLYQGSPGSAFPMPVAVVVTKADAKEILKECGGAVQIPAAADLEQIATLAFQKSGQVRAALCDWQLTPVIHLLEARFNTIGFFAASSLGRASGTTTSGFSPKNVAGAFSWLITKSRGDLSIPTPIDRIKPAIRLWRRALRGRDGIRSFYVAITLCFTVLLIVVGLCSIGYQVIFARHVHAP